YIVNEWLECKSYYFIENFDEYMDNPDQRIQEDVEMFAALTTELFLGFINAIVTLSAFISLLWIISGPLVFHFGSHFDVHIPGYLVWIALLYSVIGTYFAHKIGKKLTPLNFEKQHQEADFRYNAVHIRTYSECIALYHAKNNEKKGILRVFEKVILINLRLIGREKKLLFFTGGFQQISMIIPLIAALPMYFSKQIALGAIQQIMASFGQVESSMSYFVSSYSTIAQWRAVALRLVTFMNKLSRVAKMYSDIKESHVECSGSEIKVENLTIKAQTDRVLIQGFNISFAPGRNYLIKGPSGVGKSTFVKTLSGLWPFFTGTISFPRNKKIMYIPQQSYFPLGTLRESICYPDNYDIKDEKISEILEKVGLSRLIQCLNISKNWHEILSMGEQQKVAFIRIVLSKPDWVFLDESTSSLDIESEKNMYVLLRTELKNCSVVSVAHRESVAKYHDEEILLG
ncbi:MAG: putative ATP-binding cassette transporter, partial [Francisellaceae bacterium]